jgi:hypothetical protein
VGKKKRKAPGHIKKRNDEASAQAQKRALSRGAISCTGPIRQKKLRNWGGRPSGAKDATPRKRSRECDLLKDDADWLSTTPDPTK